MKRKRLLRIALHIISSAVAILAIACATHFATAGEKPNVVIFFADDLGWTGLSCFGSDFYETPNLDQLAADGMKFTDAYSACTVCSPTRASLMTGMYPARIRLTDFIAGQNRPFAKLKIPDWTKGLDGRHVTFAEALKENGYRTAHIGKWHLSPRGKAEGTQPTDQGFDVSYDRPPGTKGYFLKKGNESEAGTNYLTDALTDKACEFIDESHHQPFCLYFAYNVPHTPIQGREDLVEYFSAKVNENAIHKNPVYAAMVKSLDESVGRVLAQLEKLELSDNTLVMFTSDNGGLTQRYGKHDGFTENLPLRRGKGSAYEGGVRVPTIVRWPGKVRAGSVCNIPIMSIDFYPTLLEVTRTHGDPEHNKSVDGRSIVPLLNDPTQTIDRDLFWHYPHYHAGGDGPYSAIRSGDYRLIEFHEDKSLRLYNLAADIGEQKDLAAEMPEKADQLRRKLNEWRESIDAQMPTENANFDPNLQTKVAK